MSFVGLLLLHRPTLISTVWLLKGGGDGGTGQKEQPGARNHLPMTAPPPLLRTSDVIQFFPLHRTVKSVVRNNATK